MTAYTAFYIFVISLYHFNCLVFIWRKKKCSAHARASLCLLRAVWIELKIHLSKKRGKFNFRRIESYHHHFIEFLYFRPRREPYNSRGAQSLKILFLGAKIQILVKVKTYLLQKSWTRNFVNYMHVTQPRPTNVKKDEDFHSHFLHTTKKLSSISNYWLEKGNAFSCIFGLSSTELA